MLRKLFIVVLLSIGIAQVYGGLWSPAVLNESFETPVLSSGQWSYEIDDWFEGVGNNAFIEYATGSGGNGIPIALDGNQWAGSQVADGYFYQQVGTYDENQNYDIGITLGKRMNWSWEGVKVTLWAGGNPAQAADDVDLTTVGATTVSSFTFTDLASLPGGEMGTAQVSTSLDTGTGHTVDSPLWIEIMGISSGQEFFDSVSIIATDAAVLIAPAPSGITNVEPTVILEWAGPSAYTATGYDVYLGTDSSVRSNPKVVDNQLVTTYDPPGDLAWETIYYWAVDAYDGEVIHEGSTWTLTTKPEFPPPDPLKKGPYLIYTGVNTEMQVLWQVESTQYCTIEWGLDTNYSLGSIQTSEYGSDHQHSYTIPDLTPGTLYYYSVYADATDHAGTFNTAPADSATDVKFLVYGDTRTNPSDHDDVVGQMINTYTLDPEFQTIILLSGDWILSDTEGYWTDEYFPTNYDNLVQFKKELPINGCRGNHEGGGSVYNKYWPYPYESNFYWSFDYGPAHIVILDQYVNFTPGSTQYIWLENDLANTTKQWKIIVLHEPGWSASPSRDNGDVQDYIHPLCLVYDVGLILAGHNHYYARCDVDGIQHVTTGGGGAPLYDIDLGSDFLVTATKVYHHSEITIAGDQLDFIARNRSGSVIDTFMISNAPCDAVDCHVHSIVCSIERGSKGKSFGVVTVTVRDDCGKPVAGAEVTGTFTGDFDEQLSSTTNSTGVAVITTSTQAKKPAYTFCVDDITHSSLTYNSGDNVETCDSY